MLAALLQQISLMDDIAAVWFILCWAGYGMLSEHGGLAKRGLVGLSHAYRVAWARAMLQREVRIVDSALVGNLMGSVSFYANTSIYIVVGLVTVLSTVDKAIVVAQTLPFALTVGRQLWEVKLLLLLGIFVFSYFKFTWSLRQFNLLSILIGAAPMPGVAAAESERFALKLAAVNTLAGDEFNRGIRAYYFGLAALSWFWQPWALIAATTLVVIVLYRRDFASPTLMVLHE